MSQTFFAELDESKLTPRMNYILAVTALGSFTDFFAQFSVSGATFGLLSYFHTNDALTLSLSLFFLGAVVGSLVWGYLSDVVGRKLLFTIDMAILGICSILCAIVSSLSLLFLFRFIGGMVAGGDLPAAMSLMSEYTPRKARGRGFSLFWVVTHVAGALAAILGYLTFVSLGAVELQWRLMLGFGAIPAFIALVLRLRVPESARWLLKKGRVDEASAALSKVLNRPITLSKSVELSQEEAKPQAGLRDLFSRKYLGVTIGIFFAAYFPNFTNGSFATEMPYILNFFGFSQAFSLIGSVFFLYLPLTLGGIMMMFFSDKLGRMQCFYLGTISLIVLEISIAFIGKNPYALLVIVVLVSFLSRFWHYTANSWGAELYPTTVRGAATGYNTAINRASSSTATYLTPLLLSLGTMQFGASYAAFSIIGLLVGHILIGSKGRAEGKTLEIASREA